MLRAPSGTAAEKSARELGTAAKALDNRYMVGDAHDAEAEGWKSRDLGVQTLEKTFAILEVVAELGGATAREIGTALGYPLPTVYRLVQALVQSDYLVHLRHEHRFELGYKVERLSVSLRKQVGVPSLVRAEAQQLHEQADAAAYFAVYRGADVVVAFVSDCPDHPRLTPLHFGFHEAAHATAFGKIMLAGMHADSARQYLDVHGMPRMTPSTIISRRALDEHLATVGRLGIAWEHEEFVEGMTCAAVGVRNRSGAIVGAMAISSPSGDVTPQRERELERYLRRASNRVSRYYRSGATA